MYIPKEYQENPKKSNPCYDYALVRLSESYKTEGRQEFLPLSYDFINELDTANLGMYGYPDLNYQNIGIFDLKESTFQSGFGAKNRFVKIFKDKMILHTLST